MRLASQSSPRLRKAHEANPHHAAMVWLRCAWVEHRPGVCGILIMRGTENANVCPQQVQTLSKWILCAAIHVGRRGLGTLGGSQCKVLATGAGLRQQHFKSLNPTGRVQLANDTTDFS